MGVTEQRTAAWNPWMLMPYVPGRAAQDPPPLVEVHPPLEPSQLVENTPEFTVCVVVGNRDMVQVLAAKEMAMA